MATPPLTIWCNAALTTPVLTALAKSVPPHKLILSAEPQGNLSIGNPDPACRAADIAVGQPNVRDLIDSQSLKWVHITSAGYRNYDREDVRAALRNRAAIMTNSSAVYSEPCAEHALALILAVARSLPMCMQNQQARGWNTAPIRQSSQLLCDQSALIVGMGAIGRRLAELLKPLNMNLTGIRRTVKGNEPIPTKAVADLAALLPQADHVINTLPSAPGNEKFFSAVHIALMKPTAVFYNIGRGDTVDQRALIAALNKNRLRAAYLDVTDPEPPKADDPIWQAKNCHITPHTAGGHADEFQRLAAHFVANLRRYDQGQEMLDRVV